MSNLKNKNLKNLGSNLISEIRLPPQANHFPNMGEADTEAGMTLSSISLASQSDRVRLSQMHILVGPLAPNAVLSEAEDQTEQTNSDYLVFIAWDHLLRLKLKKLKKHS